MHECVCGVKVCVWMKDAAIRTRTTYSVPSMTYVYETIDTFLTLRAIFFPRAPRGRKLQSRGPRRQATSYHTV